MTTSRYRKTVSNNVLDVLINDTDPDPGDTLLIDAATTNTASVQGGTVVINLGTQDRILYTPTDGLQRSG